MNYWSDSKFADLIRGTKKPPSATYQEWEDWKKQSAEKHPIRYWFAETFLDFLETILRSPMSLIRRPLHYLNNRFILHTHALVAKKDHLQRGMWADLSSRFLPSMFGALEDFVEMECAWMHVRWDSKQDQKKYKISWLRRHGFYKGWRSKEAGIEYLKWGSSLINNQDMGVMPSDPLFNTPTRQAIEAKEILDLYLWWTEIRPKRVDPYEASDYNAISDILTEKYGMFPSFSSREKAEQALISHSLEQLSKLEEIYEKEDEEMMIRLIKIRNGLWT